MSFTLLGDPHLGKTFVHNVPLHRRGEREASVWADFERSVGNPGAPLHVCMGDLFDKWTVSFDTIMRAAKAYLEAPADTTYVILRGNHDASRDLERKSAFDLFAGLVEHRENIYVVHDAQVINDMLFLGWQPVKSAEEHLRDWFYEGATTVFGHWDIDGVTPNMIPTLAMGQLGITKAYTGHVHLPDQFVRHSVDVTVVGSMQPYAHGEGDLYVTVSLDEARRLDLRDKCVRVDLKPGEVFDLDLDCLQLQVRHPEETSELEVSYGDFDMATLFNQAFEAEGVPLAIAEQVLERFHANR
jgi:hypothetical protein